MTTWPQHLESRTLVFNTLVLENINIRLYHCSDEIWEESSESC